MEKQKIIEAFDSALSNIDFKKVYAYMILTGWKWQGKEVYIGQLTDTVHILFDSCLKSYDNNPDQMLHRSSTGGFIVSIIKWNDNSLEVDICFSMESFNSSV